MCIIVAMFIRQTTVISNYYIFRLNCLWLSAAVQNCAGGTVQI